MRDDDLAQLLRNAPPRAMLLLEDVDSIFVQRSAKTEAGGVSFSGLLNALDGAAAAEGCVLMMTTNHKERLDPALIRPGRCDVHIHVNNASKDQARRMFLRFFALEAVLEAVDSDGVITSEAHGLQTGESVRYLRYKPPAKASSSSSSEALSSFNSQPGMNAVGFVKVLDDDHLRLYSEDSLTTGLKGMVAKAKVQQILDGADRFKTRIPALQVSMAKVQSYMMKRKLLAEVEIKKEMPAALALAAEKMDANSKQFKVQHGREVNRMAAESAVVHVHELLNVEADDRTKDKIHIFDHLRRVGLQHYAPFFEHFGIHEKSELSEDVVAKMAEWHPDFKVGGPQLERLKKLIAGDLNAAYTLADISSLRDRFLEAYPNADLSKVSSFSSEASMDEATVRFIFQKLDKNGNGGLDLEEFKAWFKEQAGVTEDDIKADFAAFDKDKNNLISQAEFVDTCRQHLGRLPSLQEKVSGENCPKLHLTYVQLIKERSYSQEEDEESRSLMWRVEQAHRFQEKLEKDGKSEVSMWQLDMHFARFYNDPIAAVAKAHLLLRKESDRTREERQVKWMTTFTFLRRLGLQKYAPQMEAAGYKNWHDFKHFESKDEWVQNALMTDIGHANLCHEVNKASPQRPDLLRKFHIPEFADLKRQYMLRFPSAVDTQACAFARALTGGNSQKSVLSTIPSSIHVVN